MQHTIKNIRLTVTNVVFEFDNIQVFTYIYNRLTVTNVVFEYKWVDKKPNIHP